MSNRRLFLKSIAVASAIVPIATTGRAFAQAGYLNANDLGLLGNGSDVSQALESAIWQAAKERRPLFLPAGEYFIKNVSLTSDISIVGLRGQTILRSDAAQALFSGNNCHNIVFENLVLAGPANAAADASFGLIDLVNCEHIHIENCRLVQSARNAISLYGCSGHIQNNVIENAETAGIKSVDSKSLMISGNRIQNCGNNGVLVWRNEQGHDGTIVTNNHIQNIDWRSGGNGQNGNGINVFRASDVVVSNNVITDCAFSAVRANATVNCQIIGNNCRNLSEVAIFSEFEFSGSIVAQNIIDGAAQGISITNWNDGGHLAVCAQNIVRNIWPKSPNNPDTSPVAIAAEADVAVDGNVIENVPGFAIAAGWGPYLRNVSITDNLIRSVDSGIYISVAEGAGAVQVKDNLMHEVRGNAFVAAQWDDVVETNSARITERYPLISIADNLVN